MGNIPASLNDDNLERILRAVGETFEFGVAPHMRTVERRLFGFAEYEDAEGLESGDSH